MQVNRQRHEWLETINNKSVSKDIIFDKKQNVNNYKKINLKRKNRLLQVNRQRHKWLKIINNKSVSKDIILDNFDNVNLWFKILH